MDKIDDYTSWPLRDNAGVSTVPESETVVLVVRPGSTFGKSPAGSKVRVRKSEADEPGTKRVLMTLEEHSEIEAERERKRQARSRPRVSALKAAVDAALANQGKKATKPYG